MGRTDIFTMLSLPIHRYNVSPHVFRPSVISFISTSSCHEDLGGAEISVCLMPSTGSLVLIVQVCLAENWWRPWTSLTKRTVLVSFRLDCCESLIFCWYFFVSSILGWSLLLSRFLNYELLMVCYRVFSLWVSREKGNSALFTIVWQSRLSTCRPHSFLIMLPNARVQFSGSSYIQGTVQPSSLSSSRMSSLPPIH